MIRAVVGIALGLAIAFPAAAAGAVGDDPQPGKTTAGQATPGQTGPGQTAPGQTGPAQTTPRPSEPIVSFPPRTSVTLQVPPLPKTSVTLKVPPLPAQSKPAPAEQRKPPPAQRPSGPPPQAAPSPKPPPAAARQPVAEPRAAPEPVETRAAPPPAPVYEPPPVNEPAPVSEPQVYEPAATPVYKPRVQAAPRAAPSRASTQATRKRRAAHKPKRAAKPKPAAHKRKQAVEPKRTTKATVVPRRTHPPAEGSVTSAVGATSLALPRRALAVASAPGAGDDSGGTPVNLRLLLLAFALFGTLLVGVATVAPQLTLYWPNVFVPVARGRERLSLVGLSLIASVLFWLLAGAA